VSKQGRKGGSRRFNKKSGINTQKTGEINQPTNSGKAKADKEQFYGQRRKWKLHAGRTERQNNDKRKSATGDEIDTWDAKETRVKSVGQPVSQSPSQSAGSPVLLADNPVGGPAEHREMG
jgi:hypothetical protein